MAEGWLDRIGKALTGDYGSALGDVDEPTEIAELIEDLSPSYHGAGIPDAIEKRAPKDDMPIGSTGVFDIAGEIVQIADQRVGLAGDRKWLQYDKMIRDAAMVGAGLRAFMYLLAVADWAVNPPEGMEDNPQANEIAKATYGMLFDMRSSWASVVRKVALFQFAGFSLQEWTAKMREDGLIGLDDVAPRPQRTIRRWIRDKNGYITAVVQGLATGEVIIPRERLVYGVDDIATESPEGIGLFRQLYGRWEKLIGFEVLEDIGFTTDLRGIPVARAPLGELKKQVEEAGVPGTAERIRAETARQAMLKPFKDFIQRHFRNSKSGMMMPSDVYFSKTNDATTVSSVPKWAIELLNGDASSFDAIAKAIDRTNQEMARLLGVEHMMLGEGGGGSLALSQSKTSMFYLMLTATLSELVEIFERDLIEPIATINAWPKELWPVLGVAEIDEVDVERVTQALANLATAGAPLMPDDPAVGAIRDRLGLPRVPDDQIERAVDASLKVNRNDPQNDPNSPEGAPPRVAKRKLIISRRSAARAQMRKVA